MTEMDSLIQQALAGGFQQAAELKVSTLRFMPEIRDMCRADRCHNFNKSWTCPPACGTLEQCRRRAEKYSRGILVQSVGEIEDSFDIESMQAIERRHKDNFEKLVRKLRENDPGLLPMGAGGCTICKKCAYPGAPCRFPDRAFVSMEACGLWVSDVCEKNSLAYNYGPKHMAYTSCILVD